jgi:hypothetical protein
MQHSRFAPHPNALNHGCKGVTGDKELQFTQHKPAARNHLLSFFTRRDSREGSRNEVRETPKAK